MPTALLGADKSGPASNPQSSLGLQHRTVSVLLFTFSVATISVVLVARIKQIGSVAKA
jgi:hypothetical protein